MKLRYSAIAAALFAVSSTAIYAADNVYVDSNTVREAQRILDQRGFHARADGVMGPRTEAALREFQKSQHLAPTGRLNRQTLVALGIEQSDSGGATAQKQYGSGTIRAVQRTLDDRGFQAGPVDGVLRSQTESALREFQRSENLEATGQLNDATLQALGIPTEHAER